MKTVPAIDPTTLSKPNLREAATRAETAAAEALAAARQARLAKARFKAARKAHKQARKVARKSAKRNRKAQAFLKTLLAKTQTRELLKRAEPNKPPTPAGKSRQGNSRKANQPAARPVRSPRPKRSIPRLRDEKAETAAFLMPPGPAAPVAVLGSSTGPGPRGTGGEGSGGT